jgi:hypothetical protein
MAKRNWKRAQPRDLRHAMDLCLDYARERYNRSVDNIADLMGEVNRYTLYKWIEAGSMPVRKVKAFEHACGIDFLSRWLAMSGNKLVIEIPIGRIADPEDMQALQEITHAAIGSLLKFYKEQADSDETLAAVQTALERLAWHRANVEKCRQPELPFDEE